MRISEIYWSIQGEGFSSGVPSLFIRLSGCNLMCGGSLGHLVKEGKAKWHCDTEKVWRASVELTDELLERFIMMKAEELNSHRAHIILTGGEPTMFPNCEIVRTIRSRYPNFFFEIETNGTSSDFDYGMIDQINCSPKLSNSGMPLELRFNREAIDSIKAHRNSWFKFVIADESDLKEALETYQPDLSRVILMPACDNLQELSDATRRVLELGLKYGVRICTRLHILAYNQRTGV